MIYNVWLHLICSGKLTHLNDFNSNSEYIEINHSHNTSLVIVSDK
jgi:hypothetical protein